MSMTDLIAATQRLNEAADAYHGTIDHIDIRLQSVVNRHLAFLTIIHVDQVAGNDTNDGTAGRPLASIQEAIRQVPFYRRGSIRIRGDYTTSERLEPSNRHISLIGCAADWSYADINLNIGYGLSATNMVDTYGFYLGYNSSWDLHRIRLNVKSRAEILAAHPAAVFNSTHSAIFSRFSSNRQIAGPVMLRNCEIDITNNPYVVLFSGTVCTFELFATTQTHPLAGRYIAGVLAGTASAAVGSVQTNVVTL